MIQHPLPGVSVLLCDLDSTVRYCTVPGQPCPNTTGQQGIYPGWAEILLDYDRAGVAIGFASNQGGVKHGHLSKHDAMAAAHETLHLIAGEGGPVLDESLLRLAMGGKGSLLTKPSPGMLFDILYQLRQMYGMEPALQEVLYVGDWVTDKEAAERAGVRFMWAWDFNPSVPVNEECLRKLAHTEKKTPANVLGELAVDLTVRSRNLVTTGSAARDKHNRDLYHSVALHVFDKARQYGWKAPDDLSERITEEVLRRRGD